MLDSVGIPIYNVRQTFNSSVGTLNYFETKIETKITLVNISVAGRNSSMRIFLMWEWLSLL